MTLGRSHPSQWYAQVLSSNPEVIHTGTPFGSMTNLLKDIDMESNTMDMIGQMEWKMLDALLMGGLDNERTKEVLRERLNAITI